MGGSRAWRERTAKLVLLFVVSMGVGTSARCQIIKPDTSFQCNPHKGGCPEEFVCCSNDATRAGETFLFAFENNHRGQWGTCIREPIVNLGGCPTPCNPTWDVETLESVCGPSSSALCCQAIALQPSDCLFDPSLGEGGCFRPATGQDVIPVDECPTAELVSQLEAAGRDVDLARCHSDWRVGAHVTHQDPGPGAPDSACKQLAADGVIGFEECVAELTVANQRGFCLNKSPDVQICPSDLGDEHKLELGIPLDACTQLNVDLELLACADSEHG